MSDLGSLLFGRLFDRTGISIHAAVAFSILAELAAIPFFWRVGRRGSAGAAG